MICYQYLWLTPKIDRRTRNTIACMYTKSINNGAKIAIKITLINSEKGNRFAHCVATTRTHQQYKLVTSIQLGCTTQQPRAKMVATTVCYCQLYALTDGNAEIT